MCLSKRIDNLMNLSGRWAPSLVDVGVSRMGGVLAGVSWMGVSVGALVEAARLARQGSARIGKANRNA